mgnify:CR=1 FL=1|jgi:hypothetical protein
MILLLITLFACGDKEVQDDTATEEVAEESKA